MQQKSFVYMKSVISTTGLTHVFIARIHSVLPNKDNLFS